MIGTTQYRKQIQRDNASFITGLPIAERNARDTGEFFSWMESICNFVPARIVASQFSHIKRSQAQGERLYPTTVNDDFLENCLEADSEWSDTTNTAQRGTSVDFLFNEKAEKAHLVPNHSICHVAYMGIVQAATGCFAESHWKRRKLLNGIKDRDRRMTDSGIKHSKYNKFHLFLQKELLDSTPPALIIIPILDLSKSKTGMDHLLTTPWYFLVGKNRYTLPKSRCGMFAIAATKPIFTLE
jgi:hypothetical protein